MCMRNVTLYQKTREIKRTACNLQVAEHKKRFGNRSVSGPGSYS